jgi:hypothetical protein
MPGHHRLWFDDGQHRAAVAPDAGEPDPQQAVHGGELGAFSRANHGGYRFGGSPVPVSLELTVMYHFLIFRDATSRIGMSLHRGAEEILGAQCGTLSGSNCRPRLTGRGNWSNRLSPSPGGMWGSVVHLRKNIPQETCADHVMIVTDELSAVIYSPAKPPRQRAGLGRFLRG